MHKQLKRRNSDIFDSLSLIYKSEKQNEIGYSENENYEFYEFYTFLNSRKSSGLKSESMPSILPNYTNNSNSKFFEKNSTQLFVNFIQILIIFFFFFLIIILCKLNQMMEYIKNNMEKKSHKFDRIINFSCFESFQSFWYNLKLRRRLNKRKKKRKISRISVKKNTYLKQKSKSCRSSHESFYRSNSVISKRRSVVHRNKKKQINTEMFLNKSLNEKNCSFISINLKNEGSNIKTNNESFC